MKLTREAFVLWGKEGARIRYAKQTKEKTAEIMAKAREGKKMKREKDKNAK